MTTLGELLKKSKIDRREAELLLAFILKKDRPFVKAHSADEIGAKQTKAFLSLSKRREKHEPIAYLTKSQPFFGRDFKVNRHTLIPRPETERLVELVLQSPQNPEDQKTPKDPFTLRTRHVSRVTRRVTIVDVGTGSGCVAVSLALERPGARVIASDVSQAALKVARQNAKRFGAKIEFVKDDLLGDKLLSVIPAKAGIQKNKSKQKILFLDPRVSSGSPEDDMRVIFVANLPYLPSKDKKTMMPDVAKYEPATALFGGPDGSTLVIKLLKQIRMWNVEYRTSPQTKIQRGGHSIFSVADIRYSIFLEIDPRQINKVKALSRGLFPKHKITVQKDQFGRQRFLVIN